MAESDETREMIVGMYKRASIYDGVLELKHEPSCWTRHVSCALRRVLDILDREEYDEFG